MLMACVLAYVIKAMLIQNSDGQSMKFALSCPFIGVLSLIASE